MYTTSYLILAADYVRWGFYDQARSSLRDALREMNKVDDHRGRGHVMIALKQLKRAIAEQQR